MHQQQLSTLVADRLERIDADAYRAAQARAERRRRRDRTRGRAP